MSTIPCEDCIGGLDPYDPTSWAYVPKIPNNYIVGTSPPIPGTCPSSGDANLGIIPQKCEGEPKVPPVSVQGVPYILINQDCEPSVGSVKSCIGLDIFELPDCGSGEPYGWCSPTNSHNWYARDWVTEMGDQTDDGQYWEEYCCTLPPDTPGRTQWCPPNFWYGSSQCQLMMSSVCQPPSSTKARNRREKLKTARVRKDPKRPLFRSSTTAPPTAPPTGGWWLPQCDSYVEDNLTTAEGSAPAATGVFISALAAWANTVPSTGLDPADPFLPTLLKWGPSFGGNIKPYVTQACANVTTQQIQQDITQGEGMLAKVCACYLPPSEYYLPGVIPVECDSLCAVASSTGGLPLYQVAPDPTTGEPVAKPRVCAQTTCVISSVTIDYANSVAGGVNFEQICGSSSSGATTCVIDGFDINGANSVIPGVNLTQECGSFASANGGVIPTPSTTPSGWWDLYKYWILGAAAFFFAVALFFLLRKI